MMYIFTFWLRTLDASMLKLCNCSIW